MKRTLFFALVLTGTSQLNAGTLTVEHIGCMCGWNAYILYWEGPWLHPQINMEIDTFPYNGFSFYAGNLPHAGQDSSPIIQSYYQIVACTGQLCEPAGSVLVPKRKCEPVD